MTVMFNCAPGGKTPENKGFGGRPAQNGGRAPPTAYPELLAAPASVSSSNTPMRRNFW